jgi:hypothetical protein
MNTTPECQNVSHLESQMSVPVDRPVLIIATVILLGKSICH